MNSREKWLRDRLQKAKDLGHKLVKISRDEDGIPNWEVVDVDPLTVEGVEQYSVEPQKPWTGKDLLEALSKCSDEDLSKPVALELYQGESMELMYGGKTQCYKPAVLAVAHLNDIDDEGEYLYKHPSSTHAVNCSLWAGREGVLVITSG